MQPKIISHAFDVYHLLFLKNTFSLWVKHMKGHGYNAAKALNCPADESVEMLFKKDVPRLSGGIARLGFMQKNNLKSLVSVP